MLEKEPECRRKRLLRVGFSKPKSPSWPTHFGKVANLCVKRPLGFIMIFRKLESFVWFGFIF